MRLIFRILVASIIGFGLVGLVAMPVEINFLYERLYPSSSSFYFYAGWFQSLAASFLIGFIVAKVFRNVNKGQTTQTVTERGTEQNVLLGQNIKDGRKRY